MCTSPQQCGRLQHYVGVFDEGNAEVQWNKVEKNKIADKVTAEVEREDYYGFVFIKCSNSTVTSEDLGQPQYDEDYLNLNSESYSQLFLYPRKFRGPSRVSHSASDININMVMVDSLSRNHFYRSLPQTVKVLESLYDKDSRMVLDFQYLQALKQRTYESLESMFSGYVNVTEVPFGVYDVPYKPLPVSHLFSLYKKRGYKTLWLEDLCWNWEWGLVKDLKAMNDTLSQPALWHNFKKALAEASIDSVDVSLASCDILASTGKKDPFHNVPAVCYNGRHHHEYLLEYLQLYQSAIQNVSPFTTFTVTNVAHDETDLRVQTLDDSLALYLNFASKLKNTVTILFSDHGSTYGKFIQSSPEAHVEIFNPFLFMIFPKDVQQHLGDVQMRILKDNENRLVSLIDVHGMLLQLMGEKESYNDKYFSNKYVTPGGLMSTISSTRTCNDVPLLQPSLCVCRNFEMSVEPNEKHKVLSDFGLGILNNIILEQHRQSGSRGFGNCRPIQIDRIRKVRETHISADLTRYKLDLVVHGSEVKSRDMQEIIFLTLEVGSTKNALRLVSYERMNMYAVYSVCRDSTVELKLCICNTDADNNSGGLLSSLLFKSFYPAFNFLKSNVHADIDGHIIEMLTGSFLGTRGKIDISYPAQNPCLFTIIHRFKSGIVLMAANVCPKLHLIEVFLETENLSLSSEKYSRFLIHSGDVKMLLGGIVSNPKIEWQWKYNVKIT